MEDASESHSNNAMVRNEELANRAADSWPWLNGSMPDENQIRNVMAFLAASPASVSYRAFLSLAHACVQKPHSLYEVNHAKQYATWALRLSMFILSRDSAKWTEPIANGLRDLLGPKTFEDGYYFILDEGGADVFDVRASPWVVCGSPKFDLRVTLQEIFLIVPQIPVAVGAFYVPWARALLYQIPSGSFWLSDAPLSIPDAFCSWLIERLTTVGEQDTPTAPLFERELYFLMSKLLLHPPTAHDLIARGVVGALFSCLRSVSNTTGRRRRILTEDVFDVLHSLVRLDIKEPWFLERLAEICHDVHSTALNSTPSQSFLFLLRSMFVTYGDALPPPDLRKVLFANAPSSSLGSIEQERIALTSGVGLSEDDIALTWVHRLVYFPDGIIENLAQVQLSDGKTLLHLFMAEHGEEELIETYWLIRRWIPANAQDSNGNTPFMYFKAMSPPPSDLLGAMACDNDINTQAFCPQDRLFLQQFDWAWRSFQDTLILEFAEKGAFKHLLSASKLLGICRTHGLTFVFAQTLFKLVWLSKISIVNGYGDLTSDSTRKLMLVESDVQDQHLIRMVKRASIAILFRMHRRQRQPLLSDDLTRTLIDAAFG